MRKTREVAIIDRDWRALDVMNHQGLARRIDGRAVALILTLALAAGEADAQGLGASKPESDQPASRPSRLGPTPGAGANPLGDSPGEGGAVLENRTGGPRSTTGSGAQGARIESGPEGGSIGLPSRSTIAPVSPYGSLALTGEDDGPRDGLTLDRAIDLLMRHNLDLRSKEFEIPQADADILTAGLRANPILYTDVQCYPYGAFSKLVRPGGQTQYDINISYPLDITRKRQARTLVACRAKKVLQASSRTRLASRSTTSIPNSSTSSPPGRPSAWRGRASTSWSRSPTSPEGPPGR